MDVEKMIDIEVVDDFLDIYYFDYLHECVTESTFSWAYQKNVSTFTTNEDGWLHGFSHNLYDPPSGLNFNNTKSELWIPVMLKIEQEFVKEKGNLMRARLDMTVKSPPNTLHTPHQDLNDPHLTAIFYLTDSDGDTIIYNETTSSDTYTEKRRITPKKNRIVFFDGSLFHTGHSPSQSSCRILMNANFMK